MTDITLLIVLPFTGSLFALLGKALPLKRLWSVLGVLPLGAMAVLLAVYWQPVTGGSALHTLVGGWDAPLAIPLLMDGLAWLSSALIVVISSMVALAAFSKNKYGPSFFFFLMLLVAGMQAVVLTQDLFTMFVAFEIVAIAAYVLIAFDRSDSGLLASLKYLLLSSVGILFFLLGVFMIYRDLGTLSIAEISATTATTHAMPFAIAALCVGIGVRTAFIPFHTWLPEAHAYAPHPVSAILSGVLIKISLLAMVRIIQAFSADYFYDLLLWIGAVTALAAVIWALAQSDSKRLLAYHSISQMGYIVAAVGAAVPLSLAAGFSHAVNHAFFKSLLFLVAGTAISMTGERDLYRMQPIGSRAPLLGLMFLFGALSISGIPPFNGYASKAMITTSVSGTAAYALLWIAAVGTVASFIKISRIALPAPGGQKDALAGPGFLIHLPAVILGGLCLLSGLYWRPLSELYIRLLSSPQAAAQDALPKIFAPSKLLDTGAVLAAGVVLYVLVVSKVGKSVSTRIKRIAPELRTVLLFFVAGFALFAVVAYLAT